MRRAPCLARTLAAAALIAAALVLAPLEPAAAEDAPAAAKVSMKEFKFMPPQVTVRAGGTVTWTYDESATDPIPNCESVFMQAPSPITCPGHSTTARAKRPDGRPLWDSGVRRASGYPFSFRFDTPGRYQYYCVVHENYVGGPMVGEVVVLETTAATPDIRPAPAPASTAPTPRVSESRPPPARSTPALTPRLGTTVTSNAGPLANTGPADDGVSPVAVAMAIVALGARRRLRTVAAGFG